jgi:catalase-peroxidase
MSRSNQEWWPNQLQLDILDDNAQSLGPVGNDLTSTR